MTTTISELDSYTGTLYLLRLLFIKEDPSSYKRRMVAYWAMPSAATWKTIDQLDNLFIFHY